MNPIQPISKIPSVQRFSGRQSVQEAMAATKVSDTLRGRSITWELVQIPAEKVEQATIVWIGNERCQELLKPENLTHITATLADHGNNEWAKGRRVMGIIEVADGSCRRASCIQEGKPFNILVCNDLTDEDMNYLTNVGNQYRQPSPWEKGRHYARLERELGSLRQVEEYLRSQGERVSRRTISRCIKTAELPLQIIALLDSPSSLSPETGAELAEKLVDAIAEDDILLELLASVPERDEDGDEDGDSQVIAWLRSWTPPTKDPATGKNEKPEASIPKSRTLTSTHGEIKINGRRMAVKLTRAANEADCQWLAEQIQASIASLAIPGPLRGRGFTEAMMDEYRSKLITVADENSISPDVLQDKLLVWIADKMREEPEYNPYQVTLNIRVMRAVCKDLIEQE